MKAAKNVTPPLIQVETEYGGTIPALGGPLEIKKLLIRVLEGNIRIQSGDEGRIENLGPQATFTIKPSLDVYPR